MTRSPFVKVPCSSNNILNEMETENSSFLRGNRFSSLPLFPAFHKTRLAPSVSEEINFSIFNVNRVHLNTEEDTGITRTGSEGGNGRTLEPASNVVNLATNRILFSLIPFAHTPSSPLAPAGTRRPGSLLVPFRSNARRAEKGWNSFADRLKSIACIFSRGKRPRRW